MHKVYPKITLSLMECKKEQAGKRISERCLGKSKYCTAAQGIAQPNEGAYKNSSARIARLLLKLQIVANKLADLVQRKT